MSNIKATNESLLNMVQEFRKRIENLTTIISVRNEDLRNLSILNDQHKRRDRIS